MQDALAQEFLRQAKSHLVDDFMPKIRRCLEELSLDEVWWRPNENCNSVGNQLLHLSGNVHQWIVSGVGRNPDIRERDAEFEERRPLPKPELLGRLEDTVERAAKILDGLAAEDLLEKRHIQIYDVTVLQAVFHVVEHFSYHTGQIIHITKSLKNTDLKFYDL